MAEWQLGLSTLVVRAYLFLGVFALASIGVSRMTTPWLAASSVLLALPAMAAMWLAVAARRLMAQHQFRQGAFLRWWAGRSALAVVLSTMVATTLGLTVLLQSVFFEVADWVMLAVSPLLYAFAHAAWAARSFSQFAQPIYARRWLMRTTSMTVVLVLTLAWIGLRYATAPEHVPHYGELVHDLQQQWVSMPSGIGTWLLDAAAWGQAALALLRDVPDGTGAKVTMALLIAPVSVFSYLALSLSGLALTAADVRQLVGKSSTVGPQAAPRWRVRRAKWTALALAGIAAHLCVFAFLEDAVDAKSSPFSVTPVADCERIGEAVYRVDTISRLLAIRREAGVTLGPQSQACRMLDRVPALAEPAIESYLDWYFSLGADYARLVAMLSGGAEDLMRSRLEETLRSNRELAGLVSALGGERQRQLDVVADADQMVRRLLEEARLVIDDGQCRVVGALSDNPWTLQHRDYRQRLLARSGSALLAGGFAGRVSSKAVAGATMSRATKLLAKAAGGKSAGKLLGAGSGTLAGSLLIPGIGTLAGALVGSVVGALVGTGVDYAMLVAEEQWTRADMTEELRGAVAQFTRPLEEVFGCNP